MKNTHTANEKGDDAGKKVSGIKRHILVDSQGLPHAVAVTTAEFTDRKGALQAIDRCLPNLSCVKNVLVDGGYTGKPFAQAIQTSPGRYRAGGQTQRVAYLCRDSAALGRGRFFAWLEKCRRLYKNCERLINTSFQFIHLAFLVLLLRRS